MGFGWTKPSHHTKQNKTEHVPLSGPARLLVSEIRERAIKALGGEARLKDFPFLFPGNEKGKPLQRLDNAWKVICAAARLEGVRVHDLRHTYASHLVSGGHSLFLVGRLLGHTQAATTQRYAHIADDPLRKATEEFGAIFHKAQENRPDPTGSRPARENVVAFTAANLPMGKPNEQKAPKTSAAAEKSGVRGGDRF